jgi:RimJ/RimL family protein N-acetyltransferase
MITNSPIGHLVLPLPTTVAPDLRTIEGSHVSLVPVSQTHVGSLFESLRIQQDELWTYMPYGPFGDLSAFQDWFEAKVKSRDPWFFAFEKNGTSNAFGMGAFMRLDAPNGVIEIGNIWISPTFQRSVEATEAIFLMIEHCFETLGVRRLEWKCDALNAPSRRAAVRFGFTFEGVFLQHMIIKGRNRDTAWFAMLDSEWPQIKNGFQNWLSPSNFDENRQQKAKLQVR